MAQKIGKTLLALVCCFFATITSADITLQLQLLDKKGAAVTSLAQGDRYTLRVTIESKEQIKDNVEISGLDQFETALQGPTSMQMTAINGVVTYKRLLNFIVTASKQGEFVVGPASLTHNSQHYSSDTLAYQVVEPSEQTDNAASEATLSVILDKREYFKGEKIDVVIRFEYFDKIYALALEPFTLKNFNIIALGQPQQNTFAKNGRQGGSMEWHYQAVAKESGKLVIPAINANYQIAKDNVGGTVFTMFQQFLGPTLQTKNILSDPVSVTIHDLPSYAQNVDAVGAFRSFKISSNTKQVAEGEPLIMRCELIGDGPMHFINIALKNMPHQLSFYESKKSVALHNDEQVRIVEFVVQPLEQGKIEIPPQEFSFFNPKTAKVRTLQSHGFQITVTEPSAHDEQTTITKDENSFKQQYLPRLPQLILSILFIMASLFIWYWAAIKHLSFWCAYQARRYWMHIRLRSMLLKTVEQKNYTQAWHYLVELASLEQTKNSTEVTADDIEWSLKKIGIRSDVAHACVQLIMKASFGQTYDEQQLQQLMQQMVTKRFKVWQLLIICLFNGMSASEPTMQQHVHAYQHTFNAASLQDIEESAIDLQQLAFDAGLQLYFSALSVMPLLYWQLLLLVLCVILVVAAFYRKLFLYLVLLLCALLTTGTMAWHEYQKHGEYAIVAVTDQMRSGPSGRYAELVSMQPYALVRIIKHEDGWVLVQAQHASGWMKMESLELMRFD